jgi:hypothetical protein
MDIVEDHAIGDEVAILDPFPLDAPIVGGNQAFTTKEYPAEEPIKGFAFVSGGVNGLAELGIAEIAQDYVEFTLSRGIEMFTFHRI